MKKSIKTSLALIMFLILLSLNVYSSQNLKQHQFNGTYSGEQLNRVEFPLGGIGAGMIGIDGIGKITQVAVRNKPNLFRTPFIMAAIAVKGYPNACKVLERISQDWKILANKGSGNGSSQFGFPCFENSSFNMKFPFAEIKLQDDDIPLEISINAWSPFIPLDEDNSSLPVAALEYTFKNTTDKTIESVFSFHAENVMHIEKQSDWEGDYEPEEHIKHFKNGFILSQSCFPDKPQYKGDFAIFTEESSIVDYRWFRGGWFDAKTQLWKDISKFNMPNDTSTSQSMGASLYIPVNLKKGESKTVKVLMAWYVPHSDIRVGADALKIKNPVCDSKTGCCSVDYSSQFYEPWYTGRFKSILDVSDYWLKNNVDLFKKSKLFSETFYSSSLPSEVIESVASNLSILKSPTVLRQKDGRLWGWEGCSWNSGCCNGSCTHVWNYAQSISHLFPKLERSLRETEFLIDQDTTGHQNFRAHLPIRTPDHVWFAAADGQLGGIMKVYREWRISGDTDWLRKMWIPVKGSFTYCSNHWDPKHKGIIEEPHHNTYDIEFWGPDGMCTSYYLGALKAMIIMGESMNEDVSAYKKLFNKGKTFMENDLFNGEYFNQKIEWQNLNAKLDVSSKLWNSSYSPEALEIVKKEGPKYQYGNGCLSDGIVGAWLASMCGLPDYLNDTKTKSHLNAVYKYNFKKDLSDFANPQRSNYAFGKEGGLVLCTWPNGGELSLPFVYSNEVWTGIEYQVASHLMSQGEIEKGLDIVREVRKRYDGTIRNPFDEYECGHWYARAMSSYGLIQGMTGVRYDAVDKCLYIDSKVGDFTSFLSTETGYGTVSLKNGKPSCSIASGFIEILKFNVSGKEILN